VRVCNIECTMHILQMCLCLHLRLRLCLCIPLSHIECMIQTLFATHFSSRPSYLTLQVLTHNKLTVLPDELCQLLRLKKLSLSENNISSLPVDIGMCVCVCMYVCVNCFVDDEKIFNTYCSFRLDLSFEPLLLSPISLFKASAR
jgi:hypothetical protein